MFRTLCLRILGLALAVTPIYPAWAQQSWIETIFPETTHDFGTVARGSKLRFQFRLVNTTSYDLHIANWTTKCGCTDVKVGSRDIPPGTQTIIEATLDTTRFQGYKASGLTLKFDRPAFAEKDLNMTCFIRGDVLMNPGSVDFGNVARTAKPNVLLNLTYYGGQAGWGVSEVHTVTSHIDAKLKEISRSPGGSVQYQLVTTLNPSAPSGYFRDEVTLKTNDPQTPSIPISVTGNVQSEVMVSPAILNLGRIKAGQAVTKDILVRSPATKAFKITSANASKSDLSVEKPAEDAQPQAFHRLRVTLKAPTTPGPYHVALDIATDLPDEPPVKMTAFATITP